MVAVYFVRGLGAQQSDYILKKWGEKKAVMGTMLIAIFGILLAASTQYLWLFVFGMLINMAVRSMNSPILYTLINHRVSSTQRATLYGTITTLRRIGTIVINFSIGIGIGTIGIQQTFIVLALLLLFINIFILRSFFKADNKIY